MILKKNPGNSKTYVESHDGRESKRDGEEDEQSICLFKGQEGLVQSGMPTA